jgi:hypothetical protein
MSRLETPVCLLELGVVDDLMDRIGAYYNAININLASQ